MSSKSAELHLIVAEGPARSPAVAASSRKSATHSWSIASRLVLLFTSAASLLLLLAMFMLHWIVLRYIDDSARQFLADKAGVLRADLVEDAGAQDLRRQLKKNAMGENSGYFIRVLDASGSPVAETPHMNKALPTELFPPPSDVHHISRQAVEYRTPHNRWFLLASTLAQVKDERFTIQLAQNRSEDKRFELMFRILLAGVLLAGMAISAGMAMFVTKRGLRPLEQIAASVERIRATHLDERIGAAGWPEELQSLSHAFDEMLSRLEDSFNRLAQFSADLAHELRTPVANLRGEAEVALLKARTADEYRQVLESSVEEYGRLSGMIDSLLFLARSDAVNTEVERSTFNARTEIETLVEFYEAVAQEQEVALSCSGEGNAQADPLLFRRAVSNVISNALKFTPPGGSVTVAISENAADLEVTVRDTGCGIPPQHVGKVFDRFYRVDSSRNSQGTGLGLAIVKSIMELHRGTVEIHSEPGRGTVVTLHFPKA